MIHIQNIKISHAKILNSHVKTVKILHAYRMRNIYKISMISHAKFLISHVKIEKFTCNSHVTCTQNY